MKKVIVIGGGFGGLAEAIRLQARGYAVTILEKRDQVGGRAYQLKKNGYTFDMGPSLITAPDIIESVFLAAGKKSADYIEVEKLDPFYRIYFHDGAYMDYTGDSEKMKAEMAKFSTADANNYDAFMKAVKPIYDAVITEGLGSTMFADWSGFMKFVPRALKLGGLTPVYKFASKYFSHEYNRFAFSFHPLFIGGSPFRAPSIYIMIPYLEKNGGVWYAKGGMYSLVKAFLQVFTELGGIVRTNSDVTNIQVTNGRATGVFIGSEFHSADAVVCNSDVPFTYLNLIDEKNRKKWTDKRVKRLHMTMSCYLLYIGTNKQFPELKHHTLILSERYKELVKDIFDRKVLPEDFSIYLHVPTRSDSTMAPPGCESMYLLVPVPHLGADVDWKKMGPVFLEKILNFLEKDFGMKGLRDSIEVLEQFTPLDFESELSSYMGSAFAIEPRLSQSALFRPHNRDQDIERLYFVGAGTHPGGGVPGVLLSAEATEKCVVEDLGSAV
ncbi:MAG: phytoene desaturase [Ignavibacteria bacterium]|nr:phytoene desaturase [Ignavibacteria bacterium]